MLPRGHMLLFMTAGKVLQLDQPGLNDVHRTRNYIQYYMHHAAIYHVDHRSHLISAGLVDHVLVLELPLPHIISIILLLG